MEKRQLILIPGLLCDEAVWRHQIVHLQDLCRIHVPDFSNCRNLEEITSQILDQSSETFMLAGHSMGGWIALEVLRRNPERISQLCLLDTTGETDSPSVRERRNQMIGDARAGKIPEVIESIIQAFVIQKEVIPMIREMFLRNQGKFIFQEQLMLSRQECLSLVPDAPPSPLLIVGREDHAFSPFMMNLHRSMPSSSLEVIQNSGHMTTMEQPEAVTSLMRSWILNS